MAQPANNAAPHPPIPAIIPLPTEDDEAAAREAHPEAAAAQQRAFEAMVVAKRGEDLVAFGRARIAYLRHAPCEGLLAEFSELLSCVEEDDPNGRDYGRGAQALRELIDMVRPVVRQKEEFLVRRAAIRAELEERRRELHVFLLATAEPKRGEAAFVLRHKARALRQIGEFIVGPFGSARREEAARFAEVSHLFVAPARLER
jgi:hypothetical protein